ncbi:hypothetical protein MKX03_014091 [Papaver bracteatum]|nr:hypothetical protein MKX03_014091 [Papaver bracteatum]
MGEEELKKVEAAETPSTTTELAPMTPTPVTEEPVCKDEKTSSPPPSAEKVDDSKALAVIEKEKTEVEKISGHGSHERDSALARLESEKRMSLIKAWEESEKTKAENKALKKMSTLSAWENSKKATIEMELKKIEEKLEKKKGEYIEKMNNKIGLLHKDAEEKRAMIQAKRGEELLKAEETAAKYRATGLAPKKLFGCLG